MVIKFFYQGNPQIELIEGKIKYYKSLYEVNGISIAFNDRELDLIKQNIWESNYKNKKVNSNELCCINVPNKITIHEFLSTISTYISYIKTIKVLKSPIPNFYYFYFELRNNEYANIFYNTFNYCKFNPIEKDYLIIGEVIKITYNNHFINSSKYINYNKVLLV